MVIAEIVKNRVEQRHFLFDLQQKVFSINLHWGLTEFKVLLNFVL